MLLQPTHLAESEVRGAVAMVIRLEHVRVAAVATVAAAAAAGSVGVAGEREEQPPTSAAFRVEARVKEIPFLQCWVLSLKQTRGTAQNHDHVYSRVVRPMWSPQITRP